MASNPLLMFNLEREYSVINEQIQEYESNIQELQRSKMNLNGMVNQWHRKREPN